MFPPDGNCQMSRHTLKMYNQDDPQISLELLLNGHGKSRLLELKMPETRKKSYVKFDVFDGTTMMQENVSGIDLLVLLHPKLLRQKSNKVKCTNQSLYRK